MLAIQGPPGAGKTYTGAHMIVDLVRAGRQVGVTAVSHKVIGKLLDDVQKAAGESAVRCIRKVNEDFTDALPGVRTTTSNAEVRDALRSGAAQVAAGTAWMWAREEFMESVEPGVLLQQGYLLPLRSTLRLQTGLFMGIRGL